MSKPIQKFVKSVEDSWDLYATIAIGVLALSLTILEFIGIDAISRLVGTGDIAPTDLLVTAILISLTTLTTSSIRERNWFRQMETQLDAIRHERARLGATDFFERAGPDAYDPLKADLATAQEIRILGLSNQLTLENHGTELKQAICEGATVQVLMLDPDLDNPAVEMQAGRSTSPMGVDRARLHESEALANIQGLRAHCTEPSKLEVKGLRTLPSCGLIAVDPNEKNGKIRVKIYPYQEAKHKYPVFELHKNRDGDWYDFWLDQFDKYWQDAQVLEADADPAD